jgi:hypothetical protein
MQLRLRALVQSHAARAMPITEVPLLALALATRSPRRCHASTLPSGLTKRGAYLTGFREHLIPQPPHAPGDTARRRSRLSELDSPSLRAIAAEMEIPKL